ncbi:Putative uncharacterized protein [Moritella viscosa]|uniref:Uncharacterized protein n=2 Tax=Moritella viscosa TaxID=80854 RepID=A0ABY1HIP0_9GAMM|nr:Putative uncharacterized protein [Moritella viscosa]SHO28230.1 Putative uncharacterized protein [Moritella viscosa]
MELLFTNLYLLCANYISLFLGSLMMFIAIYKLVEHGKNPNDPRNKLSTALVIMIGGALLTNINASVSMFTATLTNNEGHCFVVYQDGEKVEEINPNGGNCYNQDGADLSPDLLKRLEESGSNSLEIMKKRVRILFSCFSAIGLIYFIKSVFLLKSVAEGSNNTTYGKVLTMMIFSTLVMDMNNTLSIIIETVKQSTAL